MTTVIAYNLEVDGRRKIGMLADTRISNSWGYPAKKLWYFEDKAAIVGSAGLPSEFGVTIMSRLETLPTKMDNSVILKVDAYGNLDLLEGTAWCSLLYGPWDYYAIGSGAGYAMAAIKAGADDLKAIKIAASMDEHTGGPWHRMEFIEEGKVTFEEIPTEGPDPTQTSQLRLPFCVPAPALSDRFPSPTS